MQRQAGFGPCPAALRYRATDAVAPEIAFRRDVLGGIACSASRDRPPARGHNECLSHQQGSATGATAMNTYTVLKSIHVAAVVTTITLFSVRGAWMLASPARLAARWVKVVPHVVDTVLLGSAIAMLLVAGWSPTQPWLATKIVGLLLYIVLGTVALKRGRTRAVRTTALVGALLTFAYIVSVAITKSPWPTG